MEIEQRSMTEAAIAADEKLNVPLLPVKEIYLNHDFNCRKWFSPVECLPLADDISVRGLIQPITVRGLRDHDEPGLKSEQHLIEQGYKYHIIAGHRRYTAYKLNNAEVIPCVIRDTYMSIFDQHDLNAVENLHRTELTLWEEAESIRHYWVADWTNQEIANKIKKSMGWVQVRVMLLHLPEKVQEMAHKDQVKQADVREIYMRRHDGQHEMIRFAAHIRDKRKRGVKGNKVYDGMERAKSATEKKVRGRPEIEKMMAHLQEVLKNRPEGNVSIHSLITNQGNTLATTVLAWASGNIINAELYSRLKSYCDTIGIPYEIPEMDNELEFAVF